MPPKPGAMRPSGARAASRPLVALLITGIACFGLGYAIARSAADARSAEAYQSGFDAAKAKVRAVAPPMPVEPVFSLSGTVIATGTDSIEMEVPQLVQDPFEEPAPTRRTVRLSADTKIVLVKYRTPEEFQQEIERSNGEPPGPYVESKGTFSDISAGTTVVAVSATDVRKAATIDATELRVDRTQ